MKAMSGFITNSRPGAVKSFQNEDIRFNDIPSQWGIILDPPESFSLSVSHDIEPHFSESLKYASFPGTKFIGYVEEKAGGEKISKGLVALIERKPRLFNKFNEIQDNALINNAKIYALAEEVPFYMKWLSRWMLMSTASAPVEYLDFSGYKWGHLENNMKLNVSNRTLIFYVNVYWTIVNKKAVYVISEAFEPYKDDIKAQVESFLMSLKESKK